MSKYIKTSKLALYLAFVNIILFGLFYFFIRLISNMLLTFTLVFGVLVFFYFINKFFLEIFIGENIDKFYDIMDSNNGMSNIRKKKRTLAEVEMEMGDWAKAKHSEILLLKQTENYRKEFLGNISHELKTPIFIAQSYIETLLDGSINDEKVNRKHLKKSLKSIVRLSAIVQELEEISKLERNPDSLIKDSFDVNSLICEVIDSLEIKINELGVFINNKSIVGTKCSVYANRDKIEQVIYNLLENALKYRAKNNAWIKINTSINNNKCTVEIEDNGIGIQKEDIPRIFERFYRVDKNRSRKKGGSGLGLAIVKHIIEAHNQSINVQSEIGKGTKFKFTLDVKHTG